MATLFSVVYYWRLTKPRIPIEFTRWFRDREWPAGRRPVDSDGDATDSSQQSSLNHVNGAQEAITVAALLCTNEKRQLGMRLACVSNKLVLFQRECKRLLAENMLTRLQRFYGDLHMPV